MRTFIRKNVNGIWKTIRVSEEDVERIRRETFYSNREKLDKIKRGMPDTIPEDKRTESQIESGITGYTEAERLAVFSTVSRHYHYGIDDFVEEMVSDGIV